MTCKPFPGSSVEQLAPGVFAWGCCIAHGVRFTYIYGPTAEYVAAVSLPRHRDHLHLHKGECDTLEEARAAAHGRASDLELLFAGLGSVRGLSAAAYHGERLAALAEP